MTEWWQVPSGQREENTMTSYNSCSVYEAKPGCLLQGSMMMPATNQERRSLWCQWDGFHGPCRTIALSPCRAPLGGCRLWGPTVCPDGPAWLSGHHTSASQGLLQRRTYNEDVANHGLSVSLAQSRNDSFWIFGEMDKQESLNFP